MRSLAAYYTNSFVTLLGANMFVYALVIYAEHLGSSKAFRGLIFFGVFAPSMILTLHAGTILDRLSRKAILFVSQLSFTILIFVLAALIYAGQLTLATAWILPVISFGAGISLSYQIPARFATLGGLVPQEKISGATIFLNVLVIVGFGVAPLLAGHIKQRYDWDVLFFSCGAIFLLGSLVLQLVTLVRRGVGVPLGNVEAFRLGMAFIKRSGTIFEMLFLTFVGQIMVGPIQVLLPEFAAVELQLSESARGEFLSMLGAGLLFGGILAGFLPKKNRGAVIIGTTIVVGVASALIANIESVFMGMVYMTVIGFFGGIMASLLPAAVQTLTPDDMRGRVMGVYTLIFRSTPALSGLLIGFVAEQAGIRDAVYLTGVIVCAAGSGAVVLLRGARDFS